MNSIDAIHRRIDTRRRIERIMAKRRIPVIAKQLALQRVTSW